MPLILEVEQFVPLLEAEDLLIVDLCSPENYALGHIPGAVHVHPAQIVSGVQPAVGKLPDVERLQALLSAIGYQKDSKIVAYDDEGGGWAGRFLWTLDVIGHDNMAYLNGGLHAWIAADGELVSDTPSPEPTRVSITVDRSRIATRDDVLASIEDAGTTIWDARSPAEYRGERVNAAKGGHIPGAVNFDWLDVMDRNRDLRIRSDIEAALAARGISADKHIITHCQTHHRSGLTWLVGKSLGFDIRAYDGSWSEWGNDPDTPVET